jgi:hypothetical protein
VRANNKDSTPEPMSPGLILANLFNDSSKEPVPALLVLETIERAWERLIHKCPVTKGSGVVTIDKQCLAAIAMSGEWEWIFRYIPSADLSNMIEILDRARLKIGEDYKESLRPEFKKIYQIMQNAQTT